jgi:hypothetical protein
MQRALFISKRIWRNPILKDERPFVESGLCTARSPSKQSCRARRWRIIANAAVALPILLLVALAWLQRC